MLLLIFIFLRCVNFQMYIVWAREKLSPFFLCYCYYCCYSFMIIISSSSYANNNVLSQQRRQRKQKILFWCDCWWSSSSIRTSSTFQVFYLVCLCVNVLIVLPPFTQNGNISQKYLGLNDEERNELQTRDRGANTNWRDSPKTHFANKSLLYVFSSCHILWFNPTTMMMMINSFCLLTQVP